MNNKKNHPFDALTPDTIMDAIEDQGYQCDGRVTALNSYENRVYQIGIESKEKFLIAKFYRPERWTEQQILEEHEFCFELKNNEIPVITPLKNKDNSSLFRHHTFYFSLFKKVGGYAPELDHKDNLAIMSRLLARVHLVGEKKAFTHRPVLNVKTFGVDSFEYISHQFIPFEHKSNYDAVCKELIAAMSEKLSEKHIRKQAIRVHGDLHIGNILMQDEIPFLVDFDDARSTIAIQDIWMLLCGESNEQKIQLEKIINAYEEFRDFPFSEIAAIDSLKALRMMHHCAWLAQRWDDPAFINAFDWFDQNSYWLTHIQDLKNQLDAINKSETGY